MKFMSELLRFEPKATYPDTSDLGNYDEGLEAIRRIRDLDPSSIDALTLASNLFGLSRTLSDAFELLDEANIMHPGGKYQLSVNPECEYLGASMALFDFPGGEQTFVKELRLPRDEDLTEILQTAPASWSNMSVIAAVRNDAINRMETAYPFMSKFSTPQAAEQYLHILQDFLSVFPDSDTRAIAG